MNVSPMLDSPVTLPVARVTGVIPRKRSKEYCGAIGSRNSPLTVVSGSMDWPMDSRMPAAACLMLSILASARTSYQGLLARTQGRD